MDMASTLVPLDAARRKATKFTLVAFDTIALSTSPAWVVKGLVPRAGITVAWGPPKSGKSFFTFDMAMHVALGWSYRGRRVAQGAVVYLVLEGDTGFRARIEAYRRRHVIDTPYVPFYCIFTRLNLAADYQALVDSIAAELDDVAPVMVVVDTLNRSFSGSESDDKDMGAFVRGADAIRTAFNCAVVIIHHSGVDTSRPRGHTSLTGAADAQLAVKRDDFGAIVVAVEWMKDGGSEGETFRSRLDVVDLGQDDDGDPVTSCIIVPDDDGPKQNQNVSVRRPLKGKKALILDAAREALAALPTTAPASNYIPVGVTVTDRENVKEYAMRRGFADVDKPDSARAQFSAGMRDLIGDGYLAQWSDGAVEWVWLTS